MTELEKLEAGLDFQGGDPEIEATRKALALKKCAIYNAIDPLDKKIRREALCDLFGTVGENVVVEQPFHCDYGKNIHIGNNAFANYNVTILDVSPVHIGNNVLIAPHVLITTVGHPLSPKARLKGLCTHKPIVIEDNVWIGGHVTILPGVRIGKNSVVAAGAVVNKDVPANVVVAGVPARVIRTLENDV